MTTDDRTLGALEARITGTEKRLERLENNMTTQLGTLAGKLDALASQMTTLAASIAGADASKATWRFALGVLAGASGWAILLFTLMGSHTGHG